MSTCEASPFSASCVSVASTAPFSLGAQGSYTTCPSAPFACLQRCGQISSPGNQTCTAILGVNGYREHHAHREHHAESQLTPA